VQPQRRQPGKRWFSGFIGFAVNVEKKKRKWSEYSVGGDISMTGASPISETPRTARVSLTLRLVLD